MNPLLSIAIPTKNRYNTLFPVLEALLKHIVGTDYEIIIHDNSSNNDLACNKILEINDSRLKYYYSPIQISVSENSNLAISKCSGKFLIFIGDDDLVSPYILRIVNMMVEKDIKCLSYAGGRGNYYWSNLKFTKEYAFHQPATLQYTKQLSIEPEKINMEIELKKVLDIGGMSTYRLPSLYHSIVAKETMDKVKYTFGSYVPGSSPDLAITIALSCVLKDFYSINYPVSITGASKNSAAGLGARDAHVARLEDVKWLPQNIIENWDPKVPQIWTAPTIWAQTIHEVLSIAKSKKSISYKNLYLYMFVYNYSIIDIIVPFIKSSSKNSLEYYYLLIFSYIKLILKKILWCLPRFVLNLLVFLRGDFKHKIIVKNIDSVNNCMIYLAEHTKI